MLTPTMNHEKDQQAKIWTPMRNQLRKLKLSRQKSSSEPDLTYRSGHGSQLTNGPQPHFTDQNEVNSVRFSSSQANLIEDKGGPGHTLGHTHGTIEQMVMKSHKAAVTRKSMINLNVQTELGPAPPADDVGETSSVEDIPGCSYATMPHMRLSRTKKKSLSRRKVQQEQQQQQQEQRIMVAYQTQGPAQNNPSTASLVSISYSEQTSLQGTNCDDIKPLNLSSPSPKVPRRAPNNQNANTKPLTCGSSISVLRQNKNRNNRQRAFSMHGSKISGDHVWKNAEMASNRQRTSNTVATCSQGPPMSPAPSHHSVASTIKTNPICRPQNESTKSDLTMVTKPAAQLKNTSFFDENQQQDIKIKANTEIENCFLIAKLKMELDEAKKTIDIYKKKLLIVAERGEAAGMVPFKSGELNELAGKTSVANYAAYL